MYRLDMSNSGMPVVLDGTLGLRSVTACLAIDFGSRDDPEGALGAAHLLEHLVMSASPGEGRQSISRWVDEVGGQGNASTSKDALAYWARVPPEHAVECVQRLVASAVQPRITAELCAEERRAVIQELLGAAADPQDAAQELFHAALFPDHPMGAPVGGEAHAFPELGAEAMLALHEGILRHAPFCLSLVGPPDILEQALEAAGKERGGGHAPAPGAPGLERRPPAPLPDVRGADSAAPGVAGGAGYAYLVCGGRGATRDDPAWPAFQVLTAAVGGSPASPLYSRLRGELGLSYEFYSLHSAYTDCGVWRMVAGCEPHEVPEVEKAVKACLRDVAQRRLSPADFTAARSQARGGLLLDHEDPVALAHLNAYWALVGLAGTPPLQRAIDAVGQVTVDQLALAADQVLASYTCVAAA